MTKKQEMTFEEALLRLEEVVRLLETGGETLDRSLALYEEGVALVRLCSARLESAEQRVRQLSGTAEDGAPVWKPFVNEENQDAK